MKKLFGMFIIAALACVLPAAADTITFTATGSNSQGGFYTAPYFLSVNGGPNIAAICVDFTHDVTVGESWDGSVTNLGSADLSSTRLGDSGFATYREEAWLYSQFLAGAAPSGDINFAVWALTSPSAMSSSGWTAGAQHWYDLATTTNLTSFDTAMVNFNVITPKDLTGTGPQEYIVATPEPGGLVLIGSGLLGLAGFGRKKLKKMI